MKIRRFIQVFALIGLIAIGIAALGKWLLPWPASAVHAWLGIGIGYLLAALTIAVMPRWWREQADEDASSQASRDFTRVAIPAMAIYAVLIAASLVLLKRGIEPVALRAVISVLPVLPMLWFIRGFLRYLRRIDELQKQIELEGIGVAAMLVSMLYFAGGFLQLAKVIDIASGAAMIWVFPLMCLGYAIGKFNAMRRFR
ncbi:MAG: hypothetical protein Q4G62_10810 [Pseudomonadota bacterium]|nr:hypothetical protein [Pseudomonadota bacterium]